MPEYEVESEEEKGDQAQGEAFGEGAKDKPRDCTAEEPGGSMDSTKPRTVVPPYSVYGLDRCAGDPLGGSGGHWRRSHDAGHGGV